MKIENLTSILEKTRGMTVREIAAESFFRIKRGLSHKLEAAIDTESNTSITDAGLMRAFGDRNLDALLAEMREPPEFLTPGFRDLSGTVQLIQTHFAGSVEITKAAAELILQKRLRVFGREVQFGDPIDWRSDPFSSTTWPFAHFTKTPLVLGQGSDIRVIWEFNRLQHLTDLGRAYALTSDERYTAQFLKQLSDWREKNPPKFGPNWTVAMEAAIRAINVVAAFQLFRFSASLNDEVVLLVLRTLFEHGRFIASNLEFSLRKTSNHYLSDLIGLFVLGLTLPRGDETQAWLEFSRRALIEEMEIQVLPDGVDYEGSTAYHRFVVEIFLLFYIASRERGSELPAWFEDRLKRMVEFVRAYTKPDGTAPSIGDSDDGRLIRFKDRMPDDHSYLLSIGAALFGDGAMKTSEVIEEEAIWWLGAEGKSAYDDLETPQKPEESAGFPDSQVFIQRAGPLYLIADCGDHGAGGRGSHAHSDALSFELYANGETLLRDPGTFVYTGDETWRNAFRSTAYHNTVRVDGEEISKIVKGSLFTLGRNIKPIVNRWERGRLSDVLDAEHSAYERLREPVKHRRVITFDKVEGYWLLEDRFSGSGRHQYEFFFNFDRGIRVRIDDGQRVIGEGRGAGLAIIPVSGHQFEVDVTERWVAPHYGTRLPASGIVFRLNADTPFSNTMLLAPYTETD